MIRGVALELMAREGLDHIQPEEWYSQQKALNVVRNVEQALGEDTLYSIGYRIPYHAVFPDTMRDVESALRSINPAYHMSVRGKNIGRYDFFLRKPGVFEIECENPYPCSFDMGIVASLVDRFRGSRFYRVSHGNGPCRARGGAWCTVRVEESSH